MNAGVRFARIGGALVAGTVSCALIAACGGGGAGSTATGPGRQQPLPQRSVHLYSAVPTLGSGPDTVAGLAIQRGITLALATAHHRAGRWRVVYRPLSSSGSGRESATEATEAGAREAATDPAAMLYIGGLESADSASAMPILNEAGIAQISPGSTYVGLTDPVAGVTSPGEPERYFPSGTRTFLRLVPSDAVQVQAQLTALKQQGCGSIGVVHQRNHYDSGLATMIVANARQYAITVPLNVAIPDRPDAAHGIATALRDHEVACAVLMASPSPLVADLTTEVHLQLPKAQIIGPAQLCRPAWSRAVAALVAGSAECTRPVLALRALPGGHQFEVAYRSHFGTDPASVYAIYGYEAAELGLQAIAKLGANGDNRAMVTRELFATRVRPSVIGTYGFTPSGDTTLDSYGLYRIDVSGGLVFAETLHPLH